MNVNSKILEISNSLFRFIMMISVVVGFSAQAQDSSHNVSEQSGAAHQGTILNLKEGEVLLNRGHWTSHMVDGYNCIKFRGDGSESWNISKCFELGTFEIQAEGVAMLTREAGTLILNGELGPESGEGRYSYTANRRFNRYLNRQFDREEVEFTLPLFLGNMETDFMDFLADHYGDLEAAQVTQLALYDVSLTDFENYLSLYREFGSKDPSLEDIVAIKLNGINREYVVELQQAGYDQLSLEQMQQARAHGVNKEVIAGLEEAGFEAVPLDLLLKTRFNGLTVGTVQLLQEISEADLTLETMIELQKRGVHETYINELRTAEFMNLDLQQVVKAKAMDVDGGFLRALNTAELDVDFPSVLLAKAAAVDTAYVNTYAASGLEDASLEELVTAKQVGLTFNGIETWNELGSGEVTFQQLLQAQMLGVDTNDLEAFRNEGIVVYSLEELISARIHGVDIGFIRQVKGIPISEISDSIPPLQEDNELDEIQTSDDAEDMTEAIARAQAALMNTSNIDTSPDNESEEVAEGDFPKALHEYITLKLTQDALSAQEALELKRQSEEVDQEAEDRGFYQLDL